MINKVRRWCLSPHPPKMILENNPPLKSYYVAIAAHNHVMEEIVEKSWQQQGRILLVVTVPSLVAIMAVETPWTLKWWWFNLQLRKCLKKFKEKSLRTVVIEINNSNQILSRFPQWIVPLPVKQSHATPLTVLQITRVQHQLKMAKYYKIE